MTSERADSPDIDALNSEFVSAVSHELRSPLAAMKVYADMLAEGDAGPLAEEQARLVGNLRSSIDRLARIVDDLSEVTQLEAGRFELEHERFDIVEAARSVVASMGSLFHERGMSAAVSATDEPIEVYGDRERTVQVLTNLLTNAHKYGAEATSAEVSISIDGKRALISVSDKGRGIGAEDREQVFEKFFRARAARSERIPGSGLGLSISRGLVEAQGGKIWVDSEEGVGSTFYFTLPLGPGEPSSD